MKCVYRYEHPTDGRQEKRKPNENENENGETRARAEEDAVFFCGRLQTATDS